VIVFFFVQPALDRGIQRLMKIACIDVFTLFCWHLIVINIPEVSRFFFWRDDQPILGPKLQVYHPSTSEDILHLELCLVLGVSPFDLEEDKLHKTYLGCVVEARA